MANDRKPTTTAAHITFEQFTESALSAALRAAEAHKLPHRPIVVGIIFNPFGGGGYGGTAATCGFAATVKPFFTAGASQPDCYRQHMMFMFDLWDPIAVQANWQAIHDAVNSGSMPIPGCPGTFDKAGFLTAFQCWKDQNFPP